MTIRNRFVFLTAVAALLVVSTPAGAADAPIARIPAVSDTSTDPAVVALFAGIRERGGKPLNLQLITGNAPKIGKAMLGLAYSLRFDATTARPVRELAILRTAQMMNAPYELAQHTKLALACGITAAQIGALKSWQHSNLFDDRQRALLGYVEEVVHGGNVDDATFASLQRYFDTREITELTITTSAYVSTALFTKSLRVAPEEDGRTSVQGSC
jgi:alkylhydroperoxidase family enzyme